MKFKDSILVKKQNAKKEDGENTSKLLKKRLVSYLIYFLLTHLLSILFFLPSYSSLSKAVFYSLITVFYINHCLFFSTSLMNPGYVESSITPLIDGKAFVYDESKKPDEEESVIESNYKLNMKSDSKRALTQGNVARTQMQKLIISPAQNYIKTIADVESQDDNYSNRESNNGFDTISIKKTPDQIESPTVIINHEEHSTKRDNGNGNKVEEAENNVTTTNENNTTSLNNPHPSSEFNVYCLECLIEIPLRAKHCTVCNRCIATFDHHCTWLSNCIGERNKAMFILFLLLQSFILCFSFVLTLFSFKFETSLNQWLKSNWSLLLFDWLNVLFFSFVFSLLVFQLKLMLTNQTSWENYSWHKIPYMRRLSGTQMSPFNDSLCRNISIVLCRKRYIPKAASSKPPKDLKDNKNDYKSIINWNERLKHYKKHK